MTKPSESQKNYIRTVRRRRRTVQFMRLFLFLFFVATILTFLTSLRIKKYTTVLKNTIVYYTKYVMITSLTCLSRS